MPLRDLSEFERALWHTLASLPAPPEAAGAGSGDVAGGTSEIQAPVGSYGSDHAWLRYPADGSRAAFDAAASWHPEFATGGTHDAGGAPRSLLEAAYLCTVPLEGGGGSPGETLQETVLSSRATARLSAIVGRARAKVASGASHGGADGSDEGGDEWLREAGAQGPALPQEHLRAMHPAWRAVHRVTSALADSFAMREAERMGRQETGRAILRRDRLAAAVASAAEAERLEAEAAGPRSAWPTLPRLTDFSEFARMAFQTDATRARAKAQKIAEKGSGSGSESESESPLPPGGSSDRTR